MGSSEGKSAEEGTVTTSSLWVIPRAMRRAAHPARRLLSLLAHHTRREGIRHEASQGLRQCLPLKIFKPKEHAHGGPPYSLQGGHTS